MPDPYLLFSFATMGESHGPGTGTAGFAGGAAGFGGAAGAAAAGLGGVEVPPVGEGGVGVAFVSD